MAAPIYPQQEQTAHGSSWPRSSSNSDPALGLPEYSNLPIASQRQHQQQQLMRVPGQHTTQSYLPGPQHLRRPSPGMHDMSSYERLGMPSATDPFCFDDLDNPSSFITGGYTDLASMGEYGSAPAVAPPRHSFDHGAYRPAHSQQQLHPMAYHSVTEALSNPQPKCVHATNASNHWSTSAALDPVDDPLMFPLVCSPKAQPPTFHGAPSTSFSAAAHISSSTPSLTRHSAPVPSNSEHQALLSQALRTSRHGSSHGASYADQFISLDALSTELPSSPHYPNSLSNPTEPRSQIYSNFSPIALPTHSSGTVTAPRSREKLDLNIALPDLPDMMTSSHPSNFVPLSGRQSASLIADEDRQRVLQQMLSNINNINNNAQQSLHAHSVHSSHQSPSYGGSYLGSPFGSAFAASPGMQDRSASEHGPRPHSHYIFPRTISASQLGDEAFPMPLQPQSSGHPPSLPLRHQDTYAPGHVVSDPNHAMQHSQQPGHQHHQHWSNSSGHGVASGRHRASPALQFNLESVDAMQQQSHDAYSLHLQQQQQRSHGHSGREQHSTVAPGYATLVSRLSGSQDDVGKAGPVGERTVRGGNTMLQQLKMAGGSVNMSGDMSVRQDVDDPLRLVVLRASPAGPHRIGVNEHGARSKRKNLREMLQDADNTADAHSSPRSTFFEDTSVHGSSKRTRTSNGACISSVQGGEGSVAGGSSMHTRLTGPMGAMGVSQRNGTGSVRNRRGPSSSSMEVIKAESKEERSLEDWLAVIAKEETGGDPSAEAALLSEFLAWEGLSKTAPNGKWRGANSRKWGKVGIEMRLTGNVPCTDGPCTELGKMICRFVDIVEERGHAGLPTVPDAAVVLSSDVTVVSTSSANEGHAGAQTTEQLSEMSDGRRESAGEVPGAIACSPLRDQGSPAGRPPAPSLRRLSVNAAERSKCVWKLVRVQDKHSSTWKTVLKEKVWLGTYHTPINAAVHHDFYKVVLAVEGCIFTSSDIPTCNQPLGKKKTHKLKLNFTLDELPGLMYKAVKFSKLWNRHKQDAERYVFRSYSPDEVQRQVQELIDNHCVELRHHVAKNEPEGTATTVERRSTRRRSMTTGSGADGDEGS